MSAARQSSRPRKASARAREAAADAEDEPETPIKKQKQTRPGGDDDDDDYEPPAESDSDDERPVFVEMRRVGDTAWRGFTMRNDAAKAFGLTPPDVSMLLNHPTKRSGKLLQYEARRPVDSDAEEAPRPRPRGQGGQVACEVRRVGDKKWHRFASRADAEGKFPGLTRGHISKLISKNPERVKLVPKHIRDTYEAQNAVDESDSDSGSDSEPDDVDGDDAWAQCDTCQKWRLLPKDHVVDEGAAWTCSLVGRSCDERADDAVEEPAGTVTPPLSVEPVSLKDLDTTPQRKKARALAAADLAAIREAYAQEKQDAGSERAPSQKRKKSEEKGCGGTRPEALNKLLEPLGDGTGRFGLACCVARGVIKFGSLRCMTQERLGDYVGRGKAVYEHLGPKSKPHVDFVQRLAAEMKFKNQTRYFYGSMCHCHLDNVTSLLHRVEKKLSSAAPGAAQVVPERARGAKKRRAGPAQVSSDDDDPPADLSDEAPAPPPAVTPEKRQRRDTG